MTWEGSNTPTSLYDPQRALPTELHVKPGADMVGEYLERVEGFEPSASTLARSRSTPELHPRNLFGNRLLRSLARRGESD